ncbi:MAG: 16S rRNA (cytosine(1402)-N(4))-methyltransferase RsmH [Clostridia bacterium]|nr:16S rRNA (cytosine(1402)-N(4))-methyltransferase RsmH [Clostridia bacterium]
MAFEHYPVMLDEAVEGLRVVPDGVYADCTLGGCGHTKKILSLLGENGRVLGIDLDTAALENASLTVKDGRLATWHGNFKDLSQAAKENGIEKLNGALFDLGVSSYQIDTAERGFSYLRDAALDMRMDNTKGATAADLVNGLTADELARIFFEYGEERYSRKIAQKIVAARANGTIETTGELASLIASAYPAKELKNGNPAKRCFQALRIAVNGELEGLDKALEDAMDLLDTGGRLVVITFHSLEDRIVKNTFNRFANPCTCPPDLPVCVCGKKPVARIITKKPVVCSLKESEENSRSHSAKLRIAEKL